jgi:hypothetical protein
VVLTDAGNLLAGYVTLSAQDVSVNTQGSLSTTVTATGNATLNSGGALISVVTATGDVSLSSAGSLSSATTAHNLTIHSGGATSLGNTFLTGDLDVSSLSGNITQTAPLNVGGSTQFNAGSGTVNLPNADNSFSGGLSVTAASSSIAGAGVSQVGDSLSSALALLPKLSDDGAPYAITLVKDPATGEGVVHLALRDEMTELPIPLPAAVQEWLLVAAGNIRFLGPQGEPLKQVQLVDDSGVLALQPTPGQRLPAEIVLKTPQGQLVVRVAKGK